MRKRLIAVLFVLAFAAIDMFAVPALPGKFKYTQPDGTVITLERHGDEYLHWTTDDSGNVVEKDDAGYYRVVPEGKIQARRAAARIRRSAAGRVRRQNSAQKNIAFGQKRFLVILVQFSDVSFTSSTAQSDFSSLLNDKGYSKNGATGSARDYYYDNSDGRFEPVFDVYGPVTLDNTMAYYGGDNADGEDKQPHLAVKEGCEALDSEIDFSQYDNDGDGAVDLVFMYYAGYGEADSKDREDTIWPHQWELTSGGVRLTLDGKIIDKYACSNELYGDRSKFFGKMCGIGTACHEFGHAMGLPDFYDTDYEENGESHGLFFFSLMCSGSYLNEGRTPPRFNAVERVMLGWMDESDVKELPGGNNISLASIKDNVAFRSNTTMDGEFFVYECRDYTGWDSYIPYGLLVYHVDKSKGRTVVGRMTPFRLWDEWVSYNSINAYGDHPCFYVIPSADQTNLNFEPQSLNEYPFPGRNKVTSYTPVDWNGEAGPEISSIRFNTTERTVYMNVKPVGVKEPSLADLGYASIDLGEGVFTAGESLELKLSVPEKSVPSSVIWYFDGNKVAGSTVRLAKGVHKVKAALTYSNGRKEFISAELKAD